MFMAAKDNSESYPSVIGSLVDTMYGINVKHYLVSYNTTILYRGKLYVIVYSTDPHERDYLIRNSCGVYILLPSWIVQQDMN